MATPFEEADFVDFVDYVTKARFRGMFEEIMNELTDMPIRYASWQQCKHFPSSHRTRLQLRQVSMRKSKSH